MDFTEALAFIRAADWQGSRLGLERITELMHRLGDPQKELRFIHVAGTNGKGSVSAMLAAILRAAGYTTGLYTSPHLFRINERIKVNGRDIADRDLAALAELAAPCVAELADPPTEFERLTAMALLYFRQKNCDVVVLEVGLGGRLDSTNVIGPPEVAVITDIGLEHTEVLGDTLEKIAAEKAGVVKPGAHVVLSAQTEEAEAVVRRVCAERGCPLRRTEPVRPVSCDLDGQVLDYRGRKDLRLRLLGTYQYKNAAAALDAVDVLAGRLGWRIPEEAVRAGLAAVTWPGRFEVLQKAPLVVVDGAHNPDGVSQLADCLRTYLPGRKLTVLMGVMADKDHAAMIRLMAPFARRFVAVAPESRRALPSSRLRAEIEALTGLPALDGETVPLGAALALRDLDPGDALCAFGSLYQAGEFRACFGKTS